MLLEFNPTWIKNPYADYRKVPDDIREASYPKVDVIDDRGFEYYESDPIKAFIGPGVVYYYRMSASNFQMELNL